MTAIRRLTIAGHDAIFELTPAKFSDDRGFFSEVYNKATLADLGFDLNFVQDNQSLSRTVGTVRGLHFQSNPFAQAKLIRVLRGAIFDVAVDLRHGSPTYGQHVSTVIRADDWTQILVPSGFAHGFCTLEPDTDVLYKVDAPYSPKHDYGLLWCDPALSIAWPVEPAAAVVSDKDKKLPRLSELASYFSYSQD